MKEIEPLKDVDAREHFLQEFKDLFEGDEVLPVEWDADKRNRAAELTTPDRIKTARLSTIPMICRGSSCPSHHVCPLYQEDLHPLGEQCPIERKMVAQLMLGIMDELDVDPDSTIEVGMVRDLVDQEIQQFRKQNLLAQEDIIQENVVGVSDNGEPILKKELHLAVDWEDKIHKRKGALLKQLLATRESRVNAGAKMLDQAQNMAKAVTSYQNMQRQLDEKLAKELGMEDKDDYIEAQESQGIIDVDGS